jgi:predicted ATPase
MIKTLAFSNYRSLGKVVMPLGQLNIITGANGTGKSNLYRALRLLAETAQGGVIGSLARDGGLQSAFWAGSRQLTKEMYEGQAPIQGRSGSSTGKRLRLGFSCEDFGYAIAFGVPPALNSLFDLDPEIKHECIWAGESYRPNTGLVDRQSGVIRVRDKRSWQVLIPHCNPFETIYNQAGDPTSSPEVMALRHRIRSWRFYDQFRTDADSPIRQPQLGTRTVALHHDGRDLAAALQTIIEIGDAQALNDAIADAFPGSSIAIEAGEDGRFHLKFSQHGLLRPLSAAELSDGTLRYLLWVAALLTPRPPLLMVLNEPETSLHQDLLPALGQLIVKASAETQVWVVSHSTRLIAAIEKSRHARTLGLIKRLGATEIEGLGILDEPSWNWPD